MNKFFFFSLFTITLFFCGFFLLDMFMLRIEQGDIYPEFSTLRADPLGTRAFYEALERLPEMQVERNMLDLETIDLPSDAVLVIAGTVDSPDPEPLIEKLEAFMEDGGRLIITLRPEARSYYDEITNEGEGEFWPFGEGEGEGYVEGEDTQIIEKDKSIADEDSSEDDEEIDSVEEEQSKMEKLMGYTFVDITERWNFEIAESSLESWKQGEVPVYAQLEQKEMALPEELPWFSSYCFLTEDAAWETVYLRKNAEISYCGCKDDENDENEEADVEVDTTISDEDETELDKDKSERITEIRDVPVVLYRSWGKGSLILCSDTYLLSNEAMQFHRHPEFLSWLIGPYGHVIFNETHIGLVRQTGMIDFIRRYRLTGVLIIGILTGILFLWRNMFSLTPRHDRAFEQNEKKITHARDISDGLSALLKRCIPPARLLKVCEQEYMNAYQHDPVMQKYARDMFKDLEPNLESREIPLRYNQLSRKIRERMFGRHE